MSHPMWVRGLKHQNTFLSFYENVVAPYVGAWIETALAQRQRLEQAVAPYVGAWIETL